MYFVVASNQVAWRLLESGLATCWQLGCLHRLQAIKLPQNCLVYVGLKAVIESSGKKASLSHELYTFIQEEGIQINVNGILHTFYGTISIISADNPASCALGGFKEGSRAHRFCRHCLIIIDQLREMVKLEILMLDLITVTLIYRLLKTDVSYGHQIYMMNIVKK